MCECVKLEMSFIIFSHISYFQKILEIRHKMREFHIELAIIERYNRDAILRLKAIRISCIIYEHNFAELAIRQNAQVLNVHSLGRLDTVVPEQSMMYVLPLRINPVDHILRVE